MSSKGVKNVVLFVLVLLCTCCSMQSPLAAQSRKAPPKAYPDKKYHVQLIAKIANGKTDEVIETLTEKVAVTPDDVEGWYVLSMAYCRKGDVPHAVEAMRRAIAQGLPVERFVAGPRDWFAPLYETAAYRAVTAELKSPVIHGPMVGNVTDRAASFWIRTAKEEPFCVLVGKDPALTSPLRTPGSFTDAERDYTGIARIESLEPDTTYYYDIVIDGNRLFGKDLPQFRTFPVEGRPAKFEIAFGGGAGYNPQHERMWDTIRGHRPLAFLFLGDNVYIDQPKVPQAQRYCYYRRQTRPEYRRFTASTSVFAIWDDHDFCTNDQWGGPKRNDPPWKIPVWKLFQENWVNPSYGGGEKHPGCWFTFRIADVQFFMLDGRYWRTDPKSANPTMLGEYQKKWLKKELERSDATFKVLASPVPWTLDAKGTSLDTWRGFADERDEIFDFLTKEKIDGVILISADRHRSDVWKIDREGDYPLWEFESSRLTNVHTHGLVEGALFGYNEKCSFGMLAFDTLADDPTVTYRIFSIDDEPIYEITVPLSDLRSTGGK
ncbi:hypothetical protein JCM19992_22710 [Thermostilla marina]